jgi:NADH-quinone oxidoreductase subunit J
MDAAFAILAALIVVSAAGAMFLRNLVHCALCLVATFGGLALVYLKLGAQFVGLVQILVYVGAVAILILFAILLTRSGEPAGQGRMAPGWPLGAGVAAAVFAVLAAAVSGSFVGTRSAGLVIEPAVVAIGHQLMTTYVLPLEVLALLLTAALIGAVIIAMKESK